MANPLVIVLSGGVAQGSAIASVLVDTPASNNNAGIPLSTAVILSSFYTPRSAAPSGAGASDGTISPQERLNLINGTRVEVIRSFSFGGDWVALSGAAKAAQIDSWALGIQTEVQAQITAQIDEVGRNRQVP